MNSVAAVWGVCLGARCPTCKKHVDLTTHPDFWSDGLFVVTEAGTPATTNTEVIFPICHTEFKATFENE